MTDDTTTTHVHIVVYEEVEPEQLEEADLADEVVADRLEALQHDLFHASLKTQPISSQCWQFSPPPPLSRLESRTYSIWT